MGTLLRKLAVSVAAAITLSGSALANETVRYATDGYGLGAIVIVAAEKGFFEKQGIDPVIQTYAFGVDTVDAVLTGNADFGVIIDLPLLTRFSAGKLISPAVIGSPKPGYHKLYASAGIKGPADFKGKTFGVATATAQEFLTREYLTQIGLDPDKDVKIVGSNDLFSIVGAMKAGNIDAAWVWGDGADPIKADKKFSFVADDSVVSQGTSAMLVTSKTFDSSKNEVVVKTLISLNEAADFIANHSEEAAALVSKKVGADPALVKAAIEDNRYMLNFAAQPVATLRAKYDFLVKAGKITPYDFKAQFDTKALLIAVPTADVDPSLR